MMENFNSKSALKCLYGSVVKCWKVTECHAYGSLQSASLWGESCLVVLGFMDMTMYQNGVFSPGSSRIGEEQTGDVDG